MNEFVKFVTFNYPKVMPVSVGLYAPTWKRHGDALEDLVLSHPDIFPGYKKGDYLIPQPLIWQYESGRHTDHWGCLWDNVIEGHDSICVGHPVNDLSIVKDLPLPSEDIGLEHGLIFLRVTYLRGYENAMMDFAEGSEEFKLLLSKVLAYAVRQTNRQLDADRDGESIFFADDLGMQTGLPIGAVRWREYIKPCYRELFALCKARSRFITMHSDGCIYEIIPDLRDCGLDVINPQFRANGLDNLKRATRGEGRYRIAVHQDLDRQLFPFATPSMLEDHIMEVTEALGSKAGGLSLYAEIAEDIPLRNIAAIMDALEKARVLFANP